MTQGAGSQSRRPGPPSGPPDPRVRAATPRRVLVVSVALGWLAAASTALLFVLLGQAVDQLAIDGAGASPTGGTASDAGGPDAPARGPAVGVGGSAWIVASSALAFVSASCAGVGTWFSERAASQTEARLRNAVVSAVFRGGSVRASAQVGRLIAAATTSVEKAAQYRASFLGPITASLSTPLLVLLVMAITVDPLTAGVLGVLVLLVPVLIGGFQRLVRPVGGAYRRSQAALTSAFLDAIQGLETLVYARAAHRRAAVLAARGEAHRRTLMRMLAVNQLLILVVDAAFSLGVVVAAAVLATVRVTTGDLSLGGGIAILLMSTLVIGPVDVVGQFFYIGIAGRAGQAQISTIIRAGDGSPLTEGAPSSEGSLSTRGSLSTAGTRSDPVTGPERDGAHADAIVLDGVSAGWPDGPSVLEGFSLRVARGERVALVGPSGAGKSTAAALIQGHLTARAGSVTVAGIDPTVDLAGVRARIAAVEQRTFLFLGSLADNLRMSAPHARVDDLWEALGKAGLRDDVAAMPDGLDTQVGEQGALLSGGQVQRVAIARAWLKDAPILVLDEPTSQVDLAAEARILAALESLAANRTVLMIAHRPGAILAADRVVRLDPIASQESRTRRGSGV